MRKYKLLPLLCLTILSGCAGTLETSTWNPWRETSSKIQVDPEVCKLWPETPYSNNFDGRQTKGEDTEKTAKRNDLNNRRRDGYCPASAVKANPA